MIYESKPRIKRMLSNIRWGGPFWVCLSFDDRGGLWYGEGLTPLDAYNKWKEPFA